MRLVSPGSDAKTYRYICESSAISELVGIELAGCYVIETDHHELSAEETYRIYTSQSASSFRNVSKFSNGLTDSE